jgi:hypothetical protein
MVTTTDGKSFETNQQEELLDRSKLRVAHGYQNLTSADQKKIARKAKRSRAAGEKEEEESAEARAREELELRDAKGIRIVSIDNSKDTVRY